MSYDVLIKFAPCFTGERCNDPKWNREGRSMYEKLRFVPGRSSVPLQVNHDEAREIGTVHSIFRGEWADGPWWMARATIPGELPCWLKRQETKASFGFASLGRRTFTKAETVADAFVTEVSVLIGKRPHEPLAEVLNVRPSASARTEPAGEVALGQGQMIRRNIGKVLAVNGQPVGTSNRVRAAVTRRFSDGSVEVTRFDAAGVAREWEIVDAW